MKRRAELSRESAARDLAARFAGASNSRRLYSTKSGIIERALTALKEEIEKQLDRAGEKELTFALLGQGFAVGGIPIMDPPSSVLRLIAAYKERDLEIIGIRSGVELSELEALFAYLSADSAEVAAVRADTYLRERGVDKITVKHLALMSGAEQGSFRDVYFRGKKALSREMRRAGDAGAVSQGAVSELAKSLLEVIVDSRAPVATLLALRDRDDFAVVHSVNTAMLAGMLAAAVGIEGEEAETIVFAALMHDVGKTKVPEAILSKRTGLSDSESALLARHTVEGARILFQTGGLDRTAAVAALGHHAPLPPRDEQILAVEIVRLADTFDSIRSCRPFDDEHAMRGAATYMVRRLGSRFNPYLLERFAGLVGVTKRGDHARLTSGEIVRVVEPNHELGLRPKIEVLDKSSGALDRGTVLDLATLELSAVSPRLLPTPHSGFNDLDPKEIDSLG